MKLLISKGKLVAVKSVTDLGIFFGITLRQGPRTPSRSFGYQNISRLHTGEQGGALLALIEELYTFMRLLRSHNYGQLDQYLDCCSTTNVYQQ